MRRHVVSFALLGLLPLVAPARASTEVAPRHPDPAEARVKAPSADSAAAAVAIGFQRDGRLRDAVRDRLVQDGRYRIDLSDQIPAEPGGLFIGGRLAELRLRAGWIDCRVNFLVARQPGAALQVQDSVAASVPLFPGQSVAERRHERAFAESACLADAAQQIVDRLDRAAR